MPEYEAKPGGARRPTGRVRGRLLANLAFWQAICVSSVVLSWIVSGFPLPFAGAPPAPRSFENQPSAFEHAEFVDEAIASLIASDAAGVVPYTPTVVSPLGVVAKKSSGKLRLIINMRYLNSHLEKRKFKFETVAVLSDLLSVNDFMWSLDISSAYHHISIYEPHWPFMGFRWRGKFYVFKSLPFGLSVACWVFTKFSREFVSHWRAAGVKVLPYMDDFLFAGDSVSTLQPQQARILSDLESGGLLVNREKCLLDFTRSIEHLGVGIDTVAGVFFATPNRWDRLQASVQRALSCRRRHMHVKLLASVAGQVISLSSSLGSLSRMFTRSMYACVNSAQSWNSHVVRSDEVTLELEFFAGLDRLKYTQPIWLASVRSVPIQVSLFVDASESGWGGFIDGVPSSAAHGYFSLVERLESSTWREARGVLELLRSHASAIRNKAVLLFTDNENVARYFAGGGCCGSRNPLLHRQLLSIFWLCLSLGVALSVQWIPRTQNEMADYLSKIVDFDDWKLNPRLFQIAEARWGAHSVDRFASHSNNMVALFNSYFWCPGSAGIDAFSQADWSSHNNWCNPPFKLMGRLLRLLREQGAVASVVVPVWPGQSWWVSLCPDGCHLAPDVVDFFELPLGFDTFLPGVYNGNTEGVGRPHWRCMVVRLDCRPGARPGGGWRVNHRRTRA